MAPSVGGVFARPFVFARIGGAHRCALSAPAAAIVLSRAPYGYRYVARSETAEARYEVIEEQAAVIRAIFHHYVEQMTLKPAPRL